MLTQTQTTLTSETHTAYAIGPIDAAKLFALQAHLSDGREITLLIPARLPRTLLTDPHFKRGYEVGSTCGDIEEGWSVPKIVNYVSCTLSGERSLSVYARVIGFLLIPYVPQGHHER